MKLLEVIEVVPTQVIFLVLTKCVLQVVSHYQGSGDRQVSVDESLNIPYPLVTFVQPLLQSIYLPLQVLFSVFKKAPVQFLHVNAFHSFQSILRDLTGHFCLCLHRPKQVICLANFGPKVHDLLAETVNFRRALAELSVHGIQRLPQALLKLLAQFGLSRILGCKRG